MSEYRLKDSMCRVINEELLPHISNRCILIDLPYHHNIGDILIWQGTENFLEANSISCLYRASCNSFKYRPLDTDVTILMLGGGSFGDLWRHHQDFRNKIIELYPDNTIIILPQTIYYEDKNLIRVDAEIFNKHKKLIICARDTYSFDFLNTYFASSENLLVPDLAYCISDKMLKQNQCHNHLNKILYLKRVDKELKTSTSPHIHISEDSSLVDIKDWPTMEYSNMMTRSLYLLNCVNNAFGNRLAWLLNFYMNSIYRKSLFRLGVRFVSPYGKIYTTRLHVAILASLLDKPFIFFDNSYGKNKQFYKTWMKDCNQIKFVDQ